MILDEDYKKVCAVLKNDIGWRNIENLPESFIDLINDVIISTKIVSKQDEFFRFRPKEQERSYNRTTS